MVGRNGDPLETVRDLIAVPPEIEELLLAAKFHPVEGREVMLSLQFRERVLEEFERLVAARFRVPARSIQQAGGFDTVRAYICKTCQAT